MRRIRVAGIELKPTDGAAYEFSVGPYDYHVRHEHAWILDRFRSSEADATEAHLDSTEVLGIRDAVLLALDLVRP